MIAFIRSLFSACSPRQRSASIPLPRSQETGSLDLELGTLHSRLSSPPSSTTSTNILVTQPHKGIVASTTEGMQRILPAVSHTPHRPNVTHLPTSGISFVLVLILMRTQPRMRAVLDVSDVTWTLSCATGGDIDVQFVSVMGKCQGCHILKVLDISNGRLGYFLVESTVVERSLLDWRGAVVDPEVSAPDGPYEYVSHYAPFSLDGGVYHVFTLSRMSRSASSR